MFDAPIRSQMVADIWDKLRERFGALLPSNLPSGQALYPVVGFPSTRARGAHAKRLPAELLCGPYGEWTGSTVEKGILSVHPSLTPDTQEVVWATLLAALRGGIWGRQRARRDFERIKNDPESQRIVAEIAKEVGPFPLGHAVLPYTPRQRGRMRKYVCACHADNIIRAASDSKDITCNLCNTKFNKV